MPTLVEAWDALLAEEPDDWFQLTAHLELDDPERLEEAALLMCAANPWHGTTWRSGRLDFRVGRHYGYGASGQLVRGLLRRLDRHDISGTLAITSSADAVNPVGTQGPTL
jgi:hypothetical protein